jgi:hypothetical protein
MPLLPAPCHHFYSPLRLLPPTPCSKDQLGGLWTGIRPVHIAVASTMVSDYTGMMVQPHKVRLLGLACCDVICFALLRLVSHRGICAVLTFAQDRAHGCAHMCPSPASSCLLPPHSALPASS